ncbi:blue-light-activated protein [bacterium BMS3Bbin05]|nr:blue-light-activated protein [bacterium BMS3Bbin05]
MVMKRTFAESGSSRSFKSVKKLLPVFVFLFTTSLIFLVWYGYRTKEVYELNRDLSVELRTVKARIDESLDIRLSVLNALSRHIQYILREGDLDHRLFNAAVKPVYISFSGFRAINWIDNKGTIKWIYPEKENLPAIGKNVLHHPDKSASLSFNQARSTGLPSMTDVVELFQGGYGVATYYPVTDRDGRITGYLNGVFRITPLIRDAVAGHIKGNFRISHKDNVLINSGNNLSNYVEDTLTRKNLSLSIMVWPGIHLLKTYSRPAMETLTLMFLLTLSIALSLSIYKIQKHYYDLKEKRMELEESETKFRSLVEHSMTGIYLIQDNLFQYVNPRFCEIFGYKSSEITGKMGTESLVYPPDWYIVKENLRKRINGELKAINYTFRAVRSDEEIIDVEVYGAQTVFNRRPAVIGMLMDISEKKKIEKQFLHTQKLESIGLLAGGIAHDFNNILTAIIGYASILAMRLKDSESIRCSEQILRVSERAANLTQGLLAFSRRQILKPRPLRISSIIADFKSVLERLVPENIEFGTEFKESRTAMADPGQVEQVMINLVTNARDSMPEGGKLSIETLDVTLDNNYSMWKPWMHEHGDYVCISVTDTGEGMNEEAKRHLFEPFFTTKEVGKGSGMGLATVYGIVKHHKGYIDFESEPAGGTSIKIYLPVSESEPEEVQVHKIDPVIALKGTETVLVAEDDEMVRSTVTKTLEENGYKVMSAVNGRDAIEILRVRHESISILLLDVIMPEKDGRKVFEEAAALGYTGKTIFMTGYSPNTIHKNFILEPGVHYLSKPFAPATLLKKVREVLDGAEK